MLVSHELQFQRSQIKIELLTISQFIIWSIILLVLMN